jgi:tetratricopeptide (TPR) repeat protein
VKNVSQLLWSAFAPALEPRTTQFRSDCISRQRAAGPLQRGIRTSSGRATCEAIAIYQQILSVKPDLPEIFNNFGHALAALGKPDAAVLAYQCVIELKPDHPKALCNWGLALAEMGRFEEAEQKYREAIRIDAGFDGAYNNLGLLRKAEGRLPEARLAFEQAILMAPRNVSYYDNLAAVRPFVAGDPYLTALESFADDATLPAADQIHLHFALAKAYEGIDKPERGFQHLLSANRLKRQQTSYEEAATLGRMDQLGKLIDRDFIEARRDSGYPSALPIFIIGMTRSGTMLIEQILTSHPEIFAAGEIDLLDKVAGSIRSTLPGIPAVPGNDAANVGGTLSHLGRALRGGPRRPGA